MGGAPRIVTLPLSPPSDVSVTHQNLPTPTLGVLLSMPWFLPCQGIGFDHWDDSGCDRKWKLGSTWTLPCLWEHVLASRLEDGNLVARVPHGSSWQSADIGPVGKPSQNQKNCPAEPNLRHWSHIFTDYINTYCFEQLDLGDSLSCSIIFFLNQTLFFFKLWHF